MPRKHPRQHRVHTRAPRYHVSEYSRGSGNPYDPSVSDETTKLLEESRKRLEWSENLRRANFEVFDKHLEYSEYETGDPHFKIGGFLKCKKCGKTFKWKEWGRGKRRAISRMGFHLRFDELIREPTIVHYFIEQWIEREQKKTERGKAGDPNLLKLIEEHKRTWQNL